MGTTFSFPLSSTTKGIFSGLIHDCMSTELHTRVYAHLIRHCLHDIMTGQAASEILSDKKKRLIQEHAQYIKVCKQRNENKPGH